MNPIVLFFHKTGSPPWFYRFSGYLIPWLWAAFLVITAIALYLGFFHAPVDYQQGATVRIMYLHVPAAWLSMLIYGMMAIMGFIALVWRIRIMEVLVIASAPVGAAFTMMALMTGSLWGRPMWGTYWVWDARLTSELVLLFLYFGVIALYNSFDEPRKAARAASLMSIVGALNLPIIYFSVEWWNTLHQGSSFGGDGPGIHPDMLLPLLLMAISTKFFYGANLLSRARLILLKQDHRKRWVQDLLTQEKH
jgi:heme exporter protein C